jgi:hypothetical protein
VSYKKIHKCFASRGAPMSEPDRNSPGSGYAPEEEIPSILNRIKALERFRDAEDDTDYKKRQLRLNILLIILTGVIAIASLFGNCIGKISSDAAKKSADAALLQAETNKMALESSIEVARTEQCAWILCTGFKFEKELKAGEFNPIFMTITNAGKTPAHHVRIKFTSRMKEDGKPEIIMTELREEDLSLGPGRELRVRFETIPETGYPFRSRKCILDS